MTDEEIEKALNCCKDDSNNICIECPIKEKDKDDCTYGSYLAGCTLVYIDRLKDEIAGLTGAVEAKQTDCDNLTSTLKEANEELRERTDEADGNVALAMEQKLRADNLEKEIKTVCKETAKEILDEVSKHYGGTWLIELYKKYGVEVEE